MGNAQKQGVCHANLVAGHKNEDTKRILKLPDFQSRQEYNKHLFRKQTELIEFTGFYQENLQRD